MLPAIERRRGSCACRRGGPCGWTGLISSAWSSTCWAARASRKSSSTISRSSPVPADMLAARNKARCPAASPTSPHSPVNPRTKPSQSAAARVRLERNLLEKRGADSIYRPWFPTAIDAQGADPLMLRQAGFDVLIEHGKSDPKRLAAAIDAGALLMLRLEGTTASRRNPGPARTDEFISTSRRRRLLASRRSPGTPPRRSRTVMTSWPRSARRSRPCGSSTTCLD